MQNKIAFILIAIILLQLIYFVVKSAKGRLNGNTAFVSRTPYIRGLITIVLFILLIVFMLL